MGRKEMGNRKDTCIMFHTPEHYDGYDQVHQKFSKLSIKILPVNIIKKMEVISINILQ
jgi:hypothetical protein